MTAATIQQGFVSAIVELLIAAVLALPELLRSNGRAGAVEGRQAEVLETSALKNPTVEVMAPTPQLGGPRTITKADAIFQDQVDPKPVIAFLAEHMPTDRGSRADWGEIYSGFRAWQVRLGQEAWPATQFGAVLRHICEQANIKVKRRGDRVFCLDRRLTWTG